MLYIAGIYIIGLAGDEGGKSERRGKESIEGYNKDEEEGHFSSRDGVRLFHMFSTVLL